MGVRVIESKQALRALVVMGCAGVLGLTTISCDDLEISDRDSRGTAFGAITVVPAGPEVTITSPQRAAFLAEGPVVVEGSVAAVDSLGSMQSVTVNGTVVPLQGDRFQTTVNLDAGLNVITASVSDAMGRSGDCSVGVLAGEFQPLTQPVEGAMGLRINDTSLDAISSVLEPIARQIDLQQLVADPVYDDALLGGLVTARVDLANPRLTLDSTKIDAEVDGLHLEVKFSAISVDVIADADVFGAAVLETATATADQAEVKARLHLSLDANDRLVANLEDADVEFINFDAQFTASTLMQIIGPLLRGWIEDELESSLSDSLINSEADLNLGLRDALNPTVPTIIEGKPFLYDVRGRSVTHDVDGFGLVLDFDAPPQSWTARGLAAPGSFHTPSLGVPPLTSSRGVELTIDDDLFNRLFHAAWAGGILELDVTAQMLASSTAGLSGGTNPAGFTVADLAQFLPEIRGAASETDPLSAKIEAGLPPILQVTGQPDLLTLSVGELYLTILVDRGSGPETLVKIAVNLTAGATVAYDPSRGLILSSNQNAQVSLDIVEQPLVRVDERRLQVVLGTALTPIIPKLVNQVGVVPVPPEVSHLSVFDLQANPQGANNERLQIELDMIR